MSDLNRYLTFAENSALDDIDRRLKLLDQHIASKDSILANAKEYWVAQSDELKTTRDNLKMIFKEMRKGDK